jgi:hypothetical protein
MGSTVLFPVTQAFVVVNAWTVHPRRRELSTSMKLAANNNKWTGFRNNADESNTAFDFSSTIKWETFYQESSQSIEWHSSVPLSVIASHIPFEAQRCIMVGCGNSELPTVVREERPNCHCIALMDSSPTCMAELQERYKQDARFQFLCGDALKLVELVHDNDVEEATWYDVVLDKGLMDAFLCGDDWNRTVIPLLEQTSFILHPETGRYILVSYQLPSSTRDFLEEVGQRVGLAWEFNVEGSNDRVGISVARKKVV